jgi:autotransporter-associated beta strand protein
MKSLSPLCWLGTGFPTAHILAGLIATHPALALNTADDFTGSATGSLLVSTNWSLGAVPSVTHDAVFTATTGIRTLTADDLTVGSFNVTATAGTFSIRNATTTATNSNLTLGGAGNSGNSVSGTKEDLLYVAAGSSIFNIRGDNTSGTGVLKLILGQSGNFNIAGTCSISSVISDDENHHAITKTGLGTLTFSGVNTYTGNTTVDAGILVLGENAGMKFVVTNDSNNRLAGVGTVTLNGVFSIDTAAVTNASGGWTLVDATSLTESYGATFSVVTTVGGVDEAWLKSSHVWTRTGGGRTWTFTEATGVLALTSTSGSTYDTWATTAPNNLSGGNAAFDIDYDHDGIDNGLEWILGGDPTRNDTPSILPHCTGSLSNGLTLEFHRASTSVSETTLVVEWGGDPGNLSNTITIGTTNTNVPPDGGNPSVYMNTPGAGMVTVNIPAVNASGDKLFARLKAIRN